MVAGVKRKGKTMKKLGILGLVLVGAVTAQAGMVTLDYKDTLDGSNIGTDYFTNTVSVGVTTLTAVFTSDNGTANLNPGGPNGLAIFGGDNNAWFDNNEAYDLSVALYSDFGTGSELDVTSSYTIKLLSATIRHANFGPQDYGVSFTNITSGIGVSDTFTSSGGGGATAGTILDYPDLTVTDTLRVTGIVDGTAKALQLQEVSFEVIPEPATLGLVAVMGGGILFIRRRFMM
jgi:hypothetical protein